MRPTPTFLERSTKIRWRLRMVGCLHMSGERNEEEKGKNQTWHRVERSSGKVSEEVEAPRDF